MAREIDQLISRLRACGCTVRLARAGHWRVTGPKGGTVTVPCSPSDPRALRNSRADIRKYLGIDLRELPRLRRPCRAVPAPEEDDVKQKREAQPVIEVDERDDLRLEVVRLYRQGLTLRQTAERAGYSYSLVRRLLLEAGEPMRDRRYRSPSAAPGTRP